jgi:hypothetical protein
MSTKIPGPDVGINQIVDAFTYKVMEERNKGPKFQPLRPSSAGKCEMELGYEYLEYKGLAEFPAESKEPSVHRLLNLGDPIEYHANREMEQAFKLMSTPIQLKYKRLEHSNQMIEGKIDLWLESPDWRCLADWKSKGDKYSRFFKSSWDEFIEKVTKTGHAVQFGEGAVFITDLEKFIDSHVDVFFNNNLYQLNSYAHSDFIMERQPTFCSILQYNKNDSRIREVRFIPSQVVFDRVKNKFNKVAKTVDETKSVEGLNKEYVLGSQKCGFCRFNKECYPADDALKAHFKTYPHKNWPKDIDRLPKKDQEELLILFSQYLELADIPANIERLEEKIISKLDTLRISKVRLPSGLIYETQRLKTGGPKNGPRTVLRRGKL